MKTRLISRSYSFPCLYNSCKIILILLNLCCTSLVASKSFASTGNYFQQEVNYTIRVTLNDKVHDLRAFERIEYINNSGDSLKELFFHLWPNAYSSNNTALAKQLLENSGRQKLFSDQYLRGYIDSIDFKVDGRNVKWDFLPDKPDICVIRLDNPLYPGDTIIITTPFHVKIPEGVTSRLGHVGQSYQISQWYPKPAVYDRSGWHPMVYLDQGEFYSEFGKFDVSMTVPSNYVIAATGKLINEEESEWLSQLAADRPRTSKSTPAANVFPPSSGLLKTVRFVQDNAHDFAWFADKRFRVMKSHLKLPDSGREIETTTMFTSDQAGVWENSIQYVNEAILYFSRLIGDYPYDTFTAVQGALSAGAGMEYPGITIIGHVTDSYDLDDVICHEVCHSWFYGALGNNERDYPFMDEGITTAYEKRYIHEKYPGKKAWPLYINNEKIARFFNIEDIPEKMIDELNWLIPARRNLDEPIDLSSENYSESQYSRIIYSKAGLGFNYLRAFLGDSLFDSIMHDYYREWKFRHPQPTDLRSVFGSGTKKDLNWFFADFLGTTKQVDYKMVRFRSDKLLIENKGTLASPLLLAGMINGSDVHEKWFDGFNGRKWIDAPRDNLTGYVIDPHHKMTELYRVNNNFRLSSVFPKADPFLTQIYFTIEDPGKRYLMYIPLPNWSREDGFMAGTAFHNGFILPKKTEYTLIPFYSFGNRKFTGYGIVSYNITPANSFIRLAKISAEGTQFGSPGFQQYRKVRLGSSVYFRKSSSSKPAEHSLYGYYLRSSDPVMILSGQKALIRPFIQLGYKIEKSGKNDPFSIIFAFESGSTFAKASAGLNYRLNYFRANSGLDINLFTGYMLRQDIKAPFYSFAASGRSGREQYLFTGFYPDRFAFKGENFWSRQMSLTEGSLVSPVNDSIGFSKRLISLSLTSTIPGLPGRFPVYPFLNMILAENGGKPQFMYESGFKTGFRNFFEIYVPLLVSRDMQPFVGTVRQNIRFVLILNGPFFISL